MLNPSRHLAFLRPLLAALICALALPPAGAAEQPRPTPRAAQKAPAKKPTTKAPIAKPAATTTPFTSQGAVDGVAAIVNKDVITTRELTDRLAQAKTRLARQQVNAPEGALARQVLERLIIEKIIAQHAEERGITVSDQALDRALQQIADNNHTDLDGLRQRAAEDGTPWEDFRAQIRNEMLQARIRERDIDPTLHISEAEVDNFLATQPNAFSGREYLVAHILLAAPEKATAADWKRLEAKAADLNRRLDAGEHFAQLAAEYSQAPDATQGGLLGWRTADRLPSIFADAIRTLTPGHRAPIIRSPSGLHIVMLVNERGGELAQGEQTRQTHARHILIKTSEVVTDDDARNRLNALRERIQNGESFEELAKVHSADLNGAKGGDLGWLTQGDTVPPFERAMDALPVGGLSEPVKTQFGWHLIQVLDRRQSALSTEQKRNLARQAIARRKSEEAFEEWLREARDSAYVDIRVDLPAADSEATPEPQ